MKLLFLYSFLTLFCFAQAKNCSLGGIVSYCPGTHPSTHQDRFWNQSTGSYYFGPCTKSCGGSKWVNIVSPTGETYCNYGNLKTLPYYVIERFKERWYKDNKKKYKYTVNNDLRFRYLSNVKNYFKYYENEAEKVDTFICKTQYNKYEFSISGHEDLPPFTNFGLPNIFHRELFLRDQQIYDNFLLEGIPEIKSAMTKSSNQSILEAIDHGWKIYPPRNRNGIAWGAFLWNLKQANKQMQKDET